HIDCGADGGAHFAAVIDCHDRELVGYEFARRGRAKEAERALEAACISRLARAHASPTRAPHRRAGRSSSRDTSSERARRRRVGGCRRRCGRERRRPSSTAPGWGGGHGRPTRGEPTLKQSTARTPWTTQRAHRKPRLMKEVVGSNLATT